MKRDTLLNSRASGINKSSSIRGNRRSSLDQSVLGAFVKASGTQTLAGLKDTLMLDDKKIINDPCQADFEEFFFLPHFSLICSEIKSEDPKYSTYKRKYLECPTEVAIYSKYYKDGKIPTKNVDYGKWKNYLNKYYMKHEQFLCNPGRSNNKKKILRSLEKMFNNDSRDSSILVFTGPANKNGHWAIQSSVSGIEFLQPRDVIAIWKKRKSEQKMLVILIDSNYSGKWAKALEQENDSSIAVQCSSEEDGISYYFDLGGYFTHNILKMMNKRANEKLLMLEEQTPSYWGNPLYIRKYTNQYLYYNDWFQMSSVAKSEYVLLEFENGAYQGFYKDGKREVWGVFKFNKGIYKGAVYNGEYSNSKMHGTGMITYDNGRIFEGDFVLGYAHGQGEEFYPNGDRFVGQVKATRKDGQGSYYYANGNTYIGQFKEDQPNGKGVFVNKKGRCKYNGDFKMGKAHGQGSYDYPNGEKYVGGWKDDIKTGYGVYSYKNKERYEGNFVNGRRNGEGTFFYKDGAKWSGIWKNDQKMGTGIHVQANGQTIEGDWVDNKIDTNVNFYKKKGTRKLRVKI